MFQIKTFRASSRQAFESSINKFLEDNSDKIKELIDVKIDSDKNQTRFDYIGTVIYKI